MPLYPFQAFIVLSALVASATATDVITIPIFGVDGPTSGVGQVVGPSGSLTSYVIEGVPATIVAGPSVYYQSYVYPDGDLMSQSCTIASPSSVRCQVYMSDSDSGSVMVSPVPASLLSNVGDYVVTITATRTGENPVPTGETPTNWSTSPVSTTAKPTRPTAASQTSTPTSEVAAKTTSSSANAQLVVDRSWVGAVLAACLAAF
ncbi:hypothetical protein ETB97_011834 [Aspergillus alliaceus]|uniref:GPI anchored protein n=1 Tax=Petromyces alliaceus TaxID=209559 RepID=A0A8H6A9M4_PETAA|nr:hypothetical protein ETB97_011834 [Aspergillus burnettii]